MQLFLILRSIPIGNLEKYLLESFEAPRSVSHLKSACKISLNTSHMLAFLVLNLSSLEKAFLKVTHQMRQSQFRNI